MSATTHTFFVKGMHCNSCVMLTERALGDLEHVKRAAASLTSCCIEVEGEFGGRSDAAIAAELSSVLRPHGYELALEAPREARAHELLIAAPIALLFAAGFIALQKLGIVSIAGEGALSYGTAFMIGVVASLSTCMAVVGGLVLSMSSSYAKRGDTIRPHLLFHASRLVTFFVLGGAIGALGTAFQLSIGASFALNMLVAAVMLMLGLNLLDVFQSTKRFQLAMPRFLSDRLLALGSAQSAATPLIAGAATFVLPCGFTQAMQVYTLSTGGALAGGLTMLSFALGTLPVLALLSFGSAGLGRSAYRGVFFKSAGLIVILFALLNVITGLAAIGIVPPLNLF